MDVAFVVPPAPFLINEKVSIPWGIGCLAAVTKAAGHSVRVLHLTGDDYRLLETLEGVEIVGITATTPQKTYADKIKTILSDILPTRPTFVIGGPHATGAPEDCIATGWDYVVRGEGESAWLTLLAGRCSGRILQEPLLPSSKLPVPDFEAIHVWDYLCEIRGRRATDIHTSRGCPYRCAFCQSHRHWCGVVRWYPIDRVQAMILELRDRWGYEAFMFQDDMFVRPFKRFSAVTNYLAELGCTYRCLIRTNSMTEAVAGQLKRTGCQSVGMGVESMVDEELVALHKGATRHDNEKALATANRWKIPVKVFIMLGIPGQTVQSVGRTVERLASFDIEAMDANILVPYPGTYFHEHMRECGLHFVPGLEQSPLKGRPHQLQSPIYTDWMTAGELTQCKNNLWDRFGNLYGHDRSQYLSSSTT